MEPSDSGNSSDQDRLEQVIADYLEEIRSGATPDREELLNRHPDLADELQEFFENHDRMHAVADPYRPPPSEEEDATLQPDEHDAQTPALPPTEPDAEDRVPPVGAKLRYFGDYELLEEIARGGMGIVYKARQTRLNRVVALKMILAGQFAGEADVRRFHTEAESAAQLDHPGIVPIFEVGEHDGHHYFSMGLVDGPSLARRIVDGPLPPPEAARLLRKITEAVQYAHDRGVIHRDLKPANILIDRDGQPRVTDFGLAKKVEGDSDLTATGQILGTPSYMPPEQAAGRIGQVRESSDIYALGAVLYAALTGRPPFQADNSLDTLMQVLEREPVPPRALNPGVPLDLETICLKCLEKDRRRRFRTATELAAELERFLNGEPILSRPISRPARVWRWCRRNPVVSGLLATVLFSLVAGTVTSTYFAIEATEQADHALQQKAAADEATILATQNAHDAEEQRNKAVEAEQATAAALQTERLTSYVHGIALAHRSFQAGEYRRARQLLNECPEEHRGWEWNYVWRSCHAELLSFDGHTSEITDVEFSPEGRRIASTSRSHLRVWDSVTGNEIYNVALRPRERLEGRIASGPLNPGSGVAFSPDGQRLAAGVHQHITIVSVEDGNELTDIRDLSLKVTTVSFSADGAHIAGGGISKKVGGPHGYAGGELVIWNAESGAEWERFPSLSTPVISVSYSPDGQYLAAGTDGAGGELPEVGEVRIWEAADCRELHVLKIRETARAGQHSSVTGVAFDHESRRVAAGCNDGSISVWGLPDGELVRVIEAHQGGVNDVCFSSDGRWIASVGDRSVRVWDSETGDKRQEFVGHSTPLTSVAFAADGHTLVSTGGFDRTLPGTSKSQQSAEAYVWDLLADQPRTKFANVRALSPNWRYVASMDVKGAVSGHVAVRDVTTNEILTSSPTIGISGSMEFGPDGDTLLATTFEGGGDLWESATGRRLVHLSGQANAGGLHARRLTISPDGRRAATDFHGVITLWDVDQPHVDGEVPTAQPLLTIESMGSYRPFADFIFSPDSRLFATPADRNPEQKVQVWEAETGVERFALGLGGDQLAFSQDGRRLAAWSRSGGFGVWDVVEGIELLRIPSHRVDSDVVFSPDGNHVAASTVQGPVIVWNVNDGSVQLSTEPYAIGSEVTFDSTGNLIACGTVDGEVVLGDVVRGHIEFVARGHDGRVSRVAFSPDSGRLATTGADRVLRIWDAEHGRELLAIAEHGHDDLYGIGSVMFSPDGNTLATKGQSLILWNGNSIDEGSDSQGIPSPSILSEPSENHE